MSLKRVNVFTVSPNSPLPNPGPNAANIVYDLDTNTLKVVTQNDFKEITHSQFSSTVDINGAPASEKTKLETTSNWNAGAYTGATITGTYAGQAFSDSTYFYYCETDNNWIRVLKA